MDLFKIKGLNFYWDKNNILFHNSDFTIKKEKLTTIIGKNGSGKTTLIKILANLLKPKKGEILLNNINIQQYKLKELAKKLSYVEQSFNENIPLKVMDILKLGTYPYLSIFNTFKDVSERIEKAIYLCNLEKLLNRDFNTLSGGEKQKVMIAKALCQSDSIILMDEPTSFLDIKNELEIFSLLKNLTEKHGYTIIVITHNINLCYQYSDEILTILEKKVEVQSKQAFLDSLLFRKVYEIDIRNIKLENKIIFYY